MNRPRYTKGGALERCSRGRTAQCWHDPDWHDDGVSGSSRRLHPIAAQRFGLHEDRLDHFLLQVLRVAVLVRDALHNDQDFCPRIFAQGSVDGHASADFGDEFDGDSLELGVARGLHALSLAARAFKKAGCLLC